LERSENQGRRKFWVSDAKPVLEVSTFKNDHMPSHQQETGEQS
jgi:hypothetical protein